MTSTDKAPERFDPPRDINWKSQPMRVDMAGEYIRHSDHLAVMQAKVAAARLEGWRAGRDAAAARCWEERGLLDGAEILTNLIRALPEPKETTHE